MEERKEMIKRKVLEGMKMADLWIIYMGLRKTKYGDECGQNKAYILSEAWNHSIFVETKRRVWNLFIRICTRIKYRKMINVACHASDIE